MKHTSSNNYERIQTIDRLKKLASQEGGVDCYVLLNFGLRSSKHIWYQTGKRYKWRVFNFIDDSTINATSDTELKRKTNIVRAIEHNALIREL